MTILTVGNKEKLLLELSSQLPGIFPNAKIITASDSLMAGKYSFIYDVDILITEINMKRMNGVQLIQFVKHEHPNVLSYLIGTKAELDDSPVIVADDITGIILYPFTEEMLIKSLKNDIKNSLFPIKGEYEN